MPSLRILKQRLYLEQPESPGHCIWSRSTWTLARIGSRLLMLWLTLERTKVLFAHLFASGDHKPRDAMNLKRAMRSTYAACAILALGTCKVAVAQLCTQANSSPVLTVDDLSCVGYD